MCPRTIFFVPPPDLTQPALRHVASCSPRTTLATVSFLPACASAFVVIPSADASLSDRTVNASVRVLAVPVVAGSATVNNVTNAKSCQHLT
eukprot:7321460-Prymnesium_polylepis.1